MASLWLRVTLRSERRSIAAVRRFVGRPLVPQGGVDVLPSGKPRLEGTRHALGFPVGGVSLRGLRQKKAAAARAPEH